jgi:deoxyribonuclease IV
MENNLLGVHCSIGGGYENAFIEAARLNIDVFQLFTKNQRQWRERTITDIEKTEFSNNFSKFNIKTAFSHSTYLINIASSNKELREKSVIALAAEVERCENLGLAFTVFHPGSFKDATESEAMKHIIEGLQLIIANTKGFSAGILIENTAGQGSTMGRSFKQLGEIIKEIDSERLGVCFDTCHAFAAGYDIRTKQGFEDTMAELDKFIGQKKLKALHLNDSKGDLGSNIDRHEHIGKGKIGTEPFRLIMNNFKHIPKVLETPKENNMDEENLKTLRSFIE